jgi:hypothetical protein
MPTDLGALARQIGEARMATHRGKQHRDDLNVFAERADDAIGHVMGVAAELAVRTRYRLPINVSAMSSQPGGDEGIDMETSIGALQVRCRDGRHTPVYLMVRRGQLATLAPWIILGLFNPQTETASLVGWTTNTVMRILAETKTFHALIGPTQCLPQERLCPMNHLAHGGLIDYVRDEEAP